MKKTTEKNSQSYQLQTQRRGRQEGKDICVVKSWKFVRLTSRLFHNDLSWRISSHQPKQGPQALSE